MLKSERWEGLLSVKSYALKTKKILNWFACKKCATRNLKKKIQFPF